MVSALARLHPPCHLVCWLPRPAAPYHLLPALRLEVMRPPPNRRVSRAPLPTSGVTSGGEMSTHLVRGRYPSVIAPTGSCARPTASCLLRLPYKAGLCRLLPASAGHRTFPTLSLQSLGRRLDPYPAVVVECIYPFLPQRHRPRVTGNTLGPRHYHYSATSAVSRLSGLQSFAHLQSPTLARPPGRTYRSRLPPVGQPGRLHHASPGWLPTPRCGIAT